MKVTILFKNKIEKVFLNVFSVETVSGSLCIEQIEPDEEYWFELEEIVSWNVEV